MPSKLRAAVETLREDGVGSLASRTVEYVQREGTRKYSAFTYEPDAPVCRVMEEDWDNLVILDACRYDQFERLSDIDGRLEARTSTGSCTPEYLAANFEGGTYYDTVYVTANPMYRKGEFDDVFHDVVDVWESDWDEANQTVHPKEMVSATLAAHEEYPDKRIVAHFVQPHYPFIGEKGEQLAARSGESLSGVEWIHQYADGDDADGDRATPWDLLDAGVLDEEDVREAYDENLRLALPHVRTLLESMPEKTVVTSDHGNLLGECVAPIGEPVYGHPPKTHAEGLLKVPWLVVEGEHRKGVRAENPTRTTTEASDVVTDRLADLGYA